MPKRIEHSDPVHPGAGGRAGRDGSRVQDRERRDLHGKANWLSDLVLDGRFWRLSGDPRCSAVGIRPVTDYPIFEGAFEIRARGSGRVLSGRFPYNRTATVRSSGRTRKERFSSGSLSWQTREFQRVQNELSSLVRDTAAEVREALEDEMERRNTFLLVGHSYDRTIADMRGGGLKVKHTAAAVEIEAALPDPDKMPSWVRDSVLAVEGGQLRGISPGFQVPARGGEKLIPEPGNPGVMIREITDAVAFEYSLVARPAYSGTKVDARADDPALTARRRLWL